MNRVYFELLTLVETWNLWTDLLTPGGGGGGVNIELNYTVEDRS